MKTYPQALATYIDLTGVLRGIMVNTCPFCGARLQRWAAGTDQSTEISHPWSTCVDDNPRSAAFLLDAYTNPSGNTVQVVADGDHDWWIFDVRYEYHEPVWYLRPITTAKLYAQMQSAIDYHLHLASNTTQALARLKGLVS